MGGPGGVPGGTRREVSQSHSGRPPKLPATFPDLPGSATEPPGASKHSLDCFPEDPTAPGRAHARRLAGFKTSPRRFPAALLCKIITCSSFCLCLKLPGCFSKLFKAPQNPLKPPKSFWTLLQKTLRPGRPRARRPAGLKTGPQRFQATLLFQIITSFLLSFYLKLPGCFLEFHQLLDSSFAARDNSSESGQQFYGPDINLCTDQGQSSSVVNTNVKQVGGTRPSGLFNMRPNHPV